MTESDGLFGMESYLRYSFETGLKLLKANRPSDDARINEYIVSIANLGSRLQGGFFEEVSVYVPRKIVWRKDYATFSEAMIDFREQLQFSQERLAVLLDCSGRTITRYELGQSHPRSGVGFEKFLKGFTSKFELDPVDKLKDLEVLMRR